MFKGEPYTQKARRVLSVVGRISTIEYAGMKVFNYQAGAEYKNIKAFGQTGIRPENGYLKKFLNAQFQKLNV